MKFRQLKRNVKQLRKLLPKRRRGRIDCGGAVYIFSHHWIFRILPKMDWDGWIIEKCEDETWKVYYTERGDISDLDSSLSEDDACTIYMRHLMKSRFRNQYTP